MRIHRRFHAAAVTALGMALLIALQGCATKGFVRKEIAADHQYTDAQVATARSRADEAMNHATMAERLATGTLEYVEVSTAQVQFAFDDWRLEPTAQTALDGMVTSLSSHPRYVFEVRGFADAQGTDRYNFRLGHERAEEVMRYLTTRHNVPSTRVAIMSFGESEPVGDNESEDGRAQNRRVQVRLLEEKVQSAPTSMIMDKQ